MKFNNRELSWISFNERVLQEAQDPTVPLIQRLRFLGIFSNNQDEFIKVRVANLIRLSKQRNGKKKTADGVLIEELLDLVNQSIDSSSKIFEVIYAKILSEMEQNGIYVINETQLSESQKSFCREYFSSEISQWLVPLLLRKSTKMPFLNDNIIYHAVKMSSINSKSSQYAIIQIPINSTCLRFIELPSSSQRTNIIFIDDIIRLCLDEIFFMFKYDTISAHTFKIMRDAHLSLDDDISKSVIEKMAIGLSERKHGEPVQLVYDKEMPKDLLDIIVDKLNLNSQGVMGGGRYHMLRDLVKFPIIDPTLENVNPTPILHPDIKRFSSIIEIISKKDIFLNYPYHTFNHLIDFLREAAIDPKVKKIFITLYRTAERSKVINTLINAAKNGKEVIVLEELMARFDEEQNVENSNLLQKEGVTVIHGFKGLKVHSKLIYIERKESKGTKGYVYIGTGNFNESTALVYSDFGLFTANPDIVEDAKAVSDFLLNTHRHFTCKKLSVSPYFMRKHFEALIRKEIRNKQRGKKAYIYAKFNSLTDIKMIELLYKASQAGVEIRLIIRGACCLQPQVKGLSENIQVISVIDKYLEHARLAIFHNDGDEQIFILSADWMTRNLDKRVEISVPVLDPDIQQTIKDIFNIQWSDNIKARDLTVMGQNNYIKNNGTPPVRSQTALYEYYKKKI